MGDLARSLGSYVEAHAMSVTITLNDDLVGPLRKQAQTRRVSVEQWALTILGHAVENPDELRSWANLNQRRFDLIQKRYSGGLDRAEEIELQELQDSVAKLLEPADRRMLDALKPYQRLAQQIAGSSDD
jgi:hypothetical protein